jgi:hypothetical protein
MAHFHSELVEGVLHNIRNSDPSIVSAFRTRGLHNLSQQTEDPSFQDAKLLRNYWECFNEIFFSKALQYKRSGFDMINRSELEWQKNSGEISGYTKEHRREVPYRYQIHAPIYILEILKSESVGDAQRMRNYIGTLLHEMIHAFIQTYTCLCDGCEERNKIHEGRKGHGRTWQTIAHAVERFCSNELGLELDLNRECELAKDSYQSGAEISSMDCQSWELSYDKVQKLVESLEGTENNDDYDDSNDDRT